MFLNGCAYYLYCYLAEMYNWWVPEMSHIDVLVCDGDQQQEAGPSFQNMGGSSCVDQLITYRLVYLRSIISRYQKREMVWSRCATLSHNTLCGNSVIDGVLESSLGITIY